MKEGWKYVKLGDIATNMFRGSGIKRDQVTSEGFPCVRYGEIYTTYNIAFDTCVSHTTEAEISSPKYFEKGDILFAITGESVEEIGKSIAYLGEEKCLLGGDIAVLQHKQNPKYLAYALSSPSAIKQKGLGKTKLKVVHTNIPSLKEIKIPLPPLSEQQSIVAHLDASFAEIDALKAKAAEEVANAKAMFDAALREEMTPKEGWERYKLGDLYDVRDGTHDSPKYQEKGYPLVTSKNLKGSYIDMNNVKYITEKDYLQINERSKVDYGDVLFAMIGTIGNATLVEEEPRYAIKNMALFKTKSIEEGRFLKLLLDCSIVLDEMHKKTKGTTQQFVSLGYLRSFIVSIPSKAKQGVILDRIDTLRSHLTELEQKYNLIAANCDALKQAILRETFE